MATSTLSPEHPASHEHEQSRRKHGWVNNDETRHRSPPAPLAMHQLLCHRPLSSDRFPSDVASDSTLWASSGPVGGAAPSRPLSSAGSPAESAGRAPAAGNSLATGEDTHVAGALKQLWWPMNLRDHRHHSFLRRHLFLCLFQTVTKTTTSLLPTVLLWVAWKLLLQPLGWLHTILTRYQQPDDRITQRITTAGLGTRSKPIKINKCLRKICFQE